MAGRIVCWFSCGAPSAVAAKLAIISNDPIKEGREIVVAHNYVAEKHPDNQRFAKECAAWLGQDIVDVTNQEYNGSARKVWDAVKFLRNESGAPCTRILKREMRKAFQRPDDIHVFGYTADEQDRVDRLLDGDPDLKLWLPLIETGTTKKECKQMIIGAGIELPAMYQLGYHNNNCIGCVKGGMGYWNKIRVDFPDVFKTMSELERKYGYALCKKERKGELMENGKHKRISYPVFLDELSPDDGNYATEPSIECGIVCEWKTPKEQEAAHE